MLPGLFIKLVLVHSPQFLILDPLNTLNFCFSHGEIEISFQPIPLIGTFYKLSHHYLVIACQKLNDVFPKARKVVGFGFVYNLRHVFLDLIMFEADDHNVLVWLHLHLNEVSISGVLVLHFHVNICEELG